MSSRISRHLPGKANLVLFGVLAVGCAGGAVESQVPTAVDTVATAAESTNSTGLPRPSPNSRSSSDTTRQSAPAAPESASAETVPLRFESLVADITTEEFEADAMAILTDPQGWGRAGFTFVVDPGARYRVVLAEGPTVDELCLPLRTFGTVSCQNGPVVALNATRWRDAVEHWELGIDTYRGYLVTHEVGHLIGQRHPTPRCPVPGRPAGVMEQQTAGLEGCIGNQWPRDWEIEYAGQRPVVYAPLPDWAPEPVPGNGER